MNFFWLFFHIYCCCVNVNSHPASKSSTCVTKVWNSFGFVSFHHHCDSYSFVRELFSLVWKFSQLPNKSFFDFFLFAGSVISMVYCGLCRSFLHALAKCSFLHSHNKEFRVEYFFLLSQFCVSANSLFVFLFRLSTVFSSVSCFLYQFVFNFFFFCWGYLLFQTLRYCVRSVFFLSNVLWSICSIVSVTSKTFCFISFFFHFFR